MTDSYSSLTPHSSDDTGKILLSSLREQGEVDRIHTNLGHRRVENSLLRDPKILSP